MLQGISNTLISLPVASIACTATGLYIGRNFCAAGIYKIGSMGAKIMASKNASEWDQTSNEYLALAKKNGIRDLTAAASLVTIGLASGYAKEKVHQEKSSYLQSFGLPAAAGGVLLTVAFAIGRKIGFNNGMEIGSAKKRMQVSEAIEMFKTQLTSPYAKRRDEAFKNVKNLI